MDITLFHAINNLAGHNAVVDAIMARCAVYLPVVYMATLVWLWIAGRGPIRRTAVLAGVSVFVAMGIGQLMGMIYPRPRPYVAGFDHLLIQRTVDTSFPSDHATVAFAVTAMLWPMRRKLAIVLGIVALFQCFARVYVGAHYPTDVLAGGILGTVVSVAIWRLTQRWVMEGHTASTDAMQVKPN